MFGGSLFGGSLFREMEDDPFFAHHHAQMNHMQSMFGGGMMGLPDPRFHNQQIARPSHGSRHGHGHGNELLPFHNSFDMFGGMFRNMDSMFNGLTQRANDPNSHSFVSSTVMSYSNNGDGAPHMYQASSQTRTAPGGIKETQKSERDSRSGVDKMAIGHHINDRSHVVERTRRREGDMEEKQDFINLDENEADAFNSEWEQRTHQVSRGLDQRSRHRHAPAALPDSRNASRTDRHRTEGQRDDRQRRDRHRRDRE